MKKIVWYDRWLYKLFCRRWEVVLRTRPELRELMIAWLKAYDVLDDDDQVEVTVTINRMKTLKQGEGPELRE